MKAVALVLLMLLLSTSAFAAQTPNVPIQPLVEASKPPVVPVTPTTAEPTAFAPTYDFDPDVELCWPDDLAPSDPAPSPVPDKPVAAPDMSGSSNMNPPDGNLRFNLGKALAQSLFLLGFQHGFRLLDPNQPDTRASLRGPFFKDWFNTARSLRGWDDGDGNMVNYIGHGTMGAVAGRIQIQNDPKGRYLEIGANEAYLKSRLKAFGFAVLYSVQFELGPISEASIGNARASEYSPHPTSYCDLVITPTVGLAWLVAEDAIDRYVIRRIEYYTQNRVIVKVARGVLNPTRTLSNVLRLKWPWYRDTRR